METSYLLRMNEDLKVKAENIAKKRGISLKAMINWILWEYVEEWESGKDQKKVKE